MTLKDTPSVISSQESEDGLSHLEWLLGMTTEPFGQEVALANLSAVQENVKEKKTSVTSGPPGLTLSASANLQLSLENKLQQLLPTAGGMMWPMTWKAKTTPVGRRYCQLAVSATRTKEIDSGLWATPDCSDRRSANSKQQGLSNQVKASLWATPNCMDAMTPRSAEALARAKLKGGCSNLKDQIHPSMWPTPKSRDYKDTGGPSELKRNSPSVAAICNGLAAQTENQGQLNPEFVCWLMGYSIAHLSSMRSAMQSYRKLPRPSSKAVRIEDLF